MPKTSVNLIFRPGTILAILVGLTLAVISPVGGEQRVITRVQRMPRLPEPLVVRDWPQVAEQYYELLLDPATGLDGNPLVVVDTSSNQFKMPSFVGPEPSDEALTCLEPVIGAKLVGLNPADLYAFSCVQAAKNW